MGGLSDEEFQHGHGVLSTDAPYQLSYDQEFDDDGKPKRTGIFSFLFTLLFHYLVFFLKQFWSLELKLFTPK